MIALPPPPKVKLGLDTCVDCHACAVGGKQWNAAGHAPDGPLRYGADLRSRS
jgi:hypothetical protein